MTSIQDLWLKETGNFFCSFIFTLLIYSYSTGYLDASTAESPCNNAVLPYISDILSPFVRFRTRYSPPESTGRGEKLICPWGFRIGFR
jgi:hypothetical protein